MELVLFGLLLLLCGGFAGLLAGLTGIGGGLLIVPLLDAIFLSLVPELERSLTFAVGTSLLIITVTTFSTARGHYLRGSLDLEILHRWKYSVGLGAITGTLLAGIVIEPLVLRIVFVLYAGYIGIKLLCQLKFTKLKFDVRRKIYVPFIIGSYASMLGIGGGTLSVPLLVSSGVKTVTAVGTSAALGCIVSLVASISYLLIVNEESVLLLGSIGYVNFISFGIIATSSMLTVSIGIRMAHRIPGSSLQRILGVILCVASLRMLWSTF